MKDYSEFIKSEYGFITDINPIIEKNIIEVTTSKTKKGKPHIFKLNQKNIKKLFDRLENQYQLLIENKEKISSSIKKETTEKTKWLHYLGSAILGITLITSIIGIFESYMFLIIPEIIGLLTGGTMVYGPIAITQKRQKSFEDTIETYQYYIEHRHEIETLAKTDNNVTNLADNKTQIELEESKKLLNAELTEELFSIQFMDKISLKELKEMIERYQISKSLEEEQYFYIEEESVENDAINEENKNKSLKITKK